MIASWTRAPFRLMPLLVVAAPAAAQPDPRTLTPAPVITSAALVQVDRDPYVDRHYWEIIIDWTHPGEDDDGCGKNPIIRFWEDDDGEFTYVYDRSGGLRRVDPGERALDWSIPVYGESRKDNRVLEIQIEYHHTDGEPISDPYPRYVYGWFESHGCYSDVSNVVRLDYDGAVPALPLPWVLGGAAVFIGVGWRRLMRRQ